MYGIFAHIYPKNQPNVAKYTIHGSYGTMDFKPIGFTNFFSEADPERARRAARQLPDAWTSEKPKGPKDPDPSRIEEDF